MNPNVEDEEGFCDANASMAPPPHGQFPVPLLTSNNNSTQSSARPPQNRALNYRSNVICHFCHRPGHIQRQCREYLQLQNQTCNTCHPSVPPRVAPPNYQSLPYASMQPRSEDQYRQNNQSLPTRSETHPLNSQGSSQMESNRWPLQNYRQ